VDNSDETPEADEELTRILESRKKNAEPQPTPPSQDETTSQRTPEEGRSEEGELVIDEEQSETGVRGEKRPSEESDTAPSSFDVNFPPNRLAKKASRTKKAFQESEESVSEGIQFSSWFGLLADFTDSQDERDM
jgi:hypothetical protein